MNGLAFLAPLSFGLLLLTPLLVFAYRNRSAAKRRIVGSLHLLKQLAIIPTRVKIKLPPRFFLELVLLLLLGLAATNPVFSPHSSHLAIVVDNSLSMGANGRLAEAKSKAEEVLALASSSDSITLFATSPSWHEVVSTRNGDVRNGIRELAISHTVDNIPAGLLLLAEAGEFDRILIITDRAATYLPSEGRDTRVEVLTVGSPTPNVYLGSLRIDLASETPSVAANIGYSGPTPTTATAGLRGSTPTTLQLNPGMVKEEIFQLPTNVGSMNGVQLLITAPNSSNSLTTDDSAWLSTAESYAGGAAIVSENGNSTFGLDKIPGLNPHAISAATFSQKQSAHPLTVYYRAAPATMPKNPALIVLPPEGNPLVPIEETLESSTVSSWEETHQILSYLDVPLLRPGRSVVFRATPWAQTIIRSERGPLVIAGEWEGVRVVAVGFELLPFEGRETPSTSILTLNILQWLRGGERLDSTALVGGTIRFSQSERVRVIAPSGKITDLTKERTTPVVLTLEEAGIYRLEDQLQKAVRSVPVNIFYPEESSTYQRHNLAVPKGLAKKSKQRVDTQPLWPTLSWLAFTMLLLDLILISHKWLRERYAG